MRLDPDVMFLLEHELLMGLVSFVNCLHIPYAHSSDKGVYMKAEKV